MSQYRLYLWRAREIYDNICFIVNSLCQTTSSLWSETVHPARFWSFRSTMPSATRFLFYHGYIKSNLLPTNPHLKLKVFEWSPLQRRLVTSLRATVVTVMTKGFGVRIQWHNQKQMPVSIVQKENESSTLYLTFHPKWENYGIAVLGFKWILWWKCEINSSFIATRIKRALKRWHGVTAYTNFKKTIVKKFLLGSVSLLPIAWKSQYLFT